MVLFDQCVCRTGHDGAGLQRLISLWSLPALPQACERRDLTASDLEIPAVFKEPSPGDQTSLRLECLTIARLLVNRFAASIERHSLKALVSFVLCRGFEPEGEQPPIAGHQLAVAVLIESQNEHVSKRK